jgi:translation initiation factor IF-3
MDKGAPRQPQIRTNYRIRVPEVRVIDADGTQLGVMSSHDAIRLALDKALDLVEVNPKADPPVCKVMDFGKYKYEQKKSANTARKNTKTVETKEVKVRPKTDEHDLDTKIRHLRRFLEEGNKAKITVRFRGREITHPEKGQEVLDEILQALEGTINVEVKPSLEGKQMSMIIAPKPGSIKRPPTPPGAPAVPGAVAQTPPQPVAAPAVDATRR